MARPKKRGIDYWPHDVDMQHDDKFVRVAAKHGEERAWFVWTRLLSELYRVGLCYRWYPEDQEVFAHKLGLKPQEAIKVVNTCIKVGLFDEDTLLKTGYLTSTSIQRRFLYTIRGRKELRVPEGVLLVEAPETISLILKKSKEKESKEHISHVSDGLSKVSNVETPNNGKPQEKKPEEKPEQAPELKKYPPIKLFPHEVEKLKERYAEEGAMLRDGIELLQAWAEKEPRQFAKLGGKTGSHYLTLRGWPLERALALQTARNRQEKSEEHLR